MAFDLGSIIAHIKADASDFNKNIDQAKNKADGFSKGLGVAAAGAKALAAGMAIAAAALGGVGLVAIASAAKLEQTSVGFEGLLGSGEAASKMMHDLSKFAAKTPFEFPELAQSARLLLAFGDTAEEVLPHLTIIGDAVSTMGGGAFEIDRVTRAIGQMAAKGKITAEEMNQLSEIGINGFKLLADATGKSEKELREMSAAGELMADEMLPKLYEQMQKDYGGGMARQSQTLTGMIATLKDEVGFFIRELIGFNQDGTIVEGGIFDKLKNVLAAFLEWLEANKETIITYIKGLMESIGNAMVAAGKIINDYVVPALKALYDAIKLLITGDFNKDIFAGMGISEDSPVVNAILTIREKFLELLNVLKQIGEFIVNMAVAAWPFIQQAIDFLKPSVDELVKAFRDDLIPALQGLWDKLVELWEYLSPILIPLLGALAVVVGVVVVGAIWLIINVLKLFVQGISKLIDWLGVALEWAGYIFTAIYLLVLGVITGIIVFFKTLADTWNAICKAIGDAAKATWDAVVAAVNWAINTVRNIINGIVNFVRSVIDQAGAIVRGIGDTFRNAFNNAVDSVRGIIDRIVGFIRDLVGKISGALSGVKDAITRPFSDAVANVQGLMQKAKAALSNLNPFQRHSPSIVDWVKRGTKVIASEYDDMANSISAGMIGVRQQTIGTSRTMANVSVAAVAAESAGFGANSGRGGDNVTINLSGVLADSPEAKRRFGLEIVDLVNDTRKAKGKAVI